jgi:hypothetical protein
MEQTALEALRNKRGIHTPAEACVLLAGESTIANDAAQELARLRADLAQVTAERDAITEAARDLLKQFTDDGVYGDNTKAYKTSWDYARDTLITKLAAALAPAQGAEGELDQQPLCRWCNEPEAGHTPTMRHKFLAANRRP